MTVQRAYDASSKEARRQVILDAAEALFVEQDTRLPSVNQIAEAAGLAKGTLYLYFRTKEDIFAALLLQGWERVIGDIEATLSAGIDPEKAIAAFIQAFVDFVTARPQLMRLDAFGNGLLEGRMSSDALRDHKAAFVALFESAGAGLDRHLGLKPGQGVELMARSQAIARGFWQTFGPTHGLAGDEAQRALEQFAAQLRDTLVQYWRGALRRNER